MFQKYEFIVMVKKTSTQHSSKLKPKMEMFSWFLGATFLFQGLEWNRKNLQKVEKPILKKF